MASGASRRDDNIGCLPRFKGQLQHVSEDIRLQHQISHSSVRERPRIVIIPCIVLATLVALGVWGVITGSNQDKSSSKAKAVMLAQQAAISMQYQLQASYAPTAALGILIEHLKSWPEVLAAFPAAAAKALSTAPPDVVTSLELAPFGLVCLAYPIPWEGAPLDLFNVSTTPRYLQMIRDNRFTTTGPIQLYQGEMGMTAQQPIYVSGVDRDELFGRDTAGLSTNDTLCPFCYNESTRTLFWGTATAIITTDTLLSSTLGALEQGGYHYRLVRPGGEDGYSATIGSAALQKTGEIVIKETVSSMADPVQVSIQPNMVSEETWTLYIEPSSGWDAGYTSWLIAIVVIGSTLISFFIFLWLANSFKSNKLLKSLLPKQVINSLKEGKYYARDHACITVLFADIVGYTMLCCQAQLNPSTIAQLLNELYNEFDALAHQHGVYKMSIIGDCYMATCGCPVALEAKETAARIARLGQSMIQTTAGFSSKIAPGVKLQIRVGIHSGPAVAAVLGSDSPQYTVLGDTVNTASRLESSGIPMKIQISFITMLLLCDDPEFSQVITERGEIQLKGRGTARTFFLGLPNTSTRTGIPASSSSMWSLLSAPFSRGRCVHLLHQADSIELCNKNTLSKLDMGQFAPLSSPGWDGDVSVSQPTTPWNTCDPGLSVCGQRDDSAAGKAPGAPEVLCAVLPQAASPQPPGLDQEVHGNPLFQSYSLRQ